MKNSMKKYKLIVISVLLMTFAACESVSYTMKGKVEGETISIDFFPNKARSVQPNLSQVFTDQLTDRFVGQTKLELVEGDADLHLEGEITGYTVRPAVIQGDETAAKNRMTITVKVRFVNSITSASSFESSFTSFEDFDQQENLADVEDALITLISQRLAEDVFNKAVVNW
jgi:hypothetical protein